MERWVLDGSLEVHQIVVGEAQVLFAVPGASLAHMSDCSFSPDSTADGELAPWEIAKAYAFHVVLEKASEILDLPAHELIGGRVDDFIASQLIVKGGGVPARRTVQQVVARCKDSSWYPGKPSNKRSGAGRKPQYTEHQKDEVARVAMGLKRQLKVPTPRRVRQRLPERSRNPVTGRAMSDKTVQRIFSERCFDETEDDPWIYLTCVSQDYLPEELKPRRVECAKYIVQHFAATSWFNQVAFDPCYSLLPKTQEKREELQIAAMGKKRWMSKDSARKGANLRAPATAKTQSSSSVRVDWTPVFARGKLLIYVVDPDTQDSSQPTKLTNAANLAKFVRNVLPGLLQSMKQKHGWSNIPRQVVHDKASYMVTHIHERLNVSFASALLETGMQSWAHETTKWLVKKFGDVYVHETVVSHIRRLLDHEFPCTRLHESPAQFKQRMQKVEDYMNSDNFAADNGGRGLPGLAKELLGRCKEVIKRQGERIPK